MLYARLFTRRLEIEYGSTAVLPHRSGGRICYSMPARCPPTVRRRPAGIVPSSLAGFQSMNSSTILEQGVAAMADTAQMTDAEGSIFSRAEADSDPQFR
jgi:hypothetical protein